MPSADTSAGAAVPDDDVAVVERVIDLVGDLKVDAALELVTDDLILEFPFRADGGPRRLEGEDARRFITALPRLFSRMQFSDVVVHGQLPWG